MYAQAFEEAGALDKLEGFASFHGADFYGLPRNPGTISLVRTAPPPEPAGEYLPLVPHVLDWSVAVGA